MIVVDTSVWIDVLNGNETDEAAVCIEMIENGQRVALTDVVYGEILQGLGRPEEVEEVARHLRAFPILRLEGLADFELAAELYRTARSAGVTIRKTLDCLIAAPCIRAGAPLLHSDRDFDLLAGCTDLKVWDSGPS